MSLKTRRRKRLENVREEQYRIVTLARQCGLCLSASAVQNRRGQDIMWHWMFDKAGKRVLNYWPSNGRWWNPETGEKGFATPDEALMIACGENPNEIKDEELIRF